MYEYENSENSIFQCSFTLWANFSASSIGILFSERNSTGPIRALTSLSRPDRVSASAKEIRALVFLLELLALLSMLRVNRNNKSGFLSLRDRAFSR